MFKKILSFFTKTSDDIVLNLENPEKFAKDFAESFTNGIKQSSIDYHNSANYPLYQQKYYILSHIMPNTDLEWEKYYNDIDEIYSDLIRLYKETNL